MWEWISLTNYSNYIFQDSNYVTGSMLLCFTHSKVPKNPKVLKFGSHLKINFSFGGNSLWEKSTNQKNTNYQNKKNLWFLIWKRPHVDIFHRFVKKSSCPWTENWVLWAHNLHGRVSDPNVLLESSNLHTLWQRLVHTPYVNCENTPQAYLSQFVSNSTKNLQ